MKNNFRGLVIAFFNYTFYKMAETKQAAGHSQLVQNGHLNKMVVLATSKIIE